MPYFRAFRAFDRQRQRADMNTEVLPQARSGIEGKEWSEIPGIKGSRAAYSLLIIMVIPSMNVE